jgi:hypothetical protein
VGRKAGLSDEKLSAAHGDDMTPFNDTERLVIQLADALADTPSNVSDELYARLRNQFRKSNSCNWEGRSLLKIIAPVGIASSTSEAITCTPRKRSNHQNRDQKTVI